MKGKKLLKKLIKESDSVDVFCKHCKYDDNCMLSYPTGRQISQKLCDKICYKSLLKGK